ncbi:DUF986 family protein [[Haemophilus] felis]|uniref:UPF0266 membrane protein B0188_01180 n=1 Tax=[Haemophilus] felis TaxID=123822 RepID=A0A1T0BB17_9PAST|nr:DUF986 family protein [[Haemophilus] felis]NBI41536.1 DUF986 family protein [[Haemophilus] felis]OOS07162.1 hypothetical protein B0188_01180 [[Haemophilus] felis]
MTNIILLLGILLAFAYAIYDQVIMDRHHGKTQLAVVLKRQGGVDMWISIGLIVLTIAQGVQAGIRPLTLFLLVFCILLAVYIAFIRTPRLLLKAHGFFFGNLFFDYQQIRQLNVAEGQILVIDLHNGRRLLVRIEQAQDLDNVVNFFGDYK